MGFFSGLVSKPSVPKAGLGAPKTSKAIAERIKNILGIRQLETMPAQAARAFQLASDPKATASDFVDVIEADEAISSRVIKIANSVYFFRGSPANDIEKAVANIGLDELRCLLSASMLRSLLKGKHAAREQAWANAVGTAITARLFSRYVDNVGEGAAFLCGLVHDIGKLVMIRRGNELYDRVIRKVSVGGLSFVEAEEQVFELNHVEVGKWVAELWNFPPTVVQAIAHHHDAWPDDPTTKKRNTPLPILVKAADCFTHAAGIGHPSAMSPFQKEMRSELPRAFDQLGISTADGERIIETIKQQFDKEYGLYQLEAGN